MVVHGSVTDAEGGTTPFLGRKGSDSTVDLGSYVQVRVEITSKLFAEPASSPKKCFMLPP
jgi:hypothetical protein